MAFYNFRLICQQRSLCKVSLIMCRRWLRAIPSYTSVRLLSNHWLRIYKSRKCFHCFSFVVRLFLLPSDARWFLVVLTARGERKRERKCCVCEENVRKIAFSVRRENIFGKVRREKSFCLHISVFIGRSCRWTLRVFSNRRKYHKNVPPFNGSHVGSRRNNKQWELIGCCRGGMA